MPQSHMSIPEALVWIELMENKQTVKSVCLDVEQSFDQMNDLILNLNIKTQDQSIAYRLEYNPRELTMKVFKKNQLISLLKYIIRNHKLEEIQGSFNGKSFLLDPVWHPHVSHQLREEYLRYGDQTISFTVHNEEKRALFRSSGQESVMKVELQDPLKEDQGRVFHYKTIEFGNQSFKIQLLYVDGLLTPIAGEWVVENQ